MHLIQVMLFLLQWKGYKIYTQTGPTVLYSRGSITYNVPDWVSFDWIFSSQWKTTKYDEDEDDVGEVMMMNEVMAGDSETKLTLGMSKIKISINDNHHRWLGHWKILKMKYQFFFPRMKKELPSGIGTIFSLGWKLSTFMGVPIPLKKISNEK